MASPGELVHLDEFRRRIRTDGAGGFVTEPVDWSADAPPGTGDVRPEHADPAATLQVRLEEVPVVVNTSSSTTGRRTADHPREALECFG